MAPFLLLLVLLAEAASDLIEVVHPGDDVTLQCKADHSLVSAVEWSRADLEPDYVLLYSDGHLEPDDQHQSFKDRVELVDRHLKDGNVSLTLKNVSRHDTGTYKCGVKVAPTDPISTISTIHLQVTDQPVVKVRPGDDVTLQCKADHSLIRAVEWSRADLKPDTILIYSDKRLETDDHHPSFKGRVELVESDLKDGDVSLTLKNVCRHDTGTYECGVRVAPTDPISTIRTIRLQVTDLTVPVHPGDDVILPCRANDSSIRVVKWTRPGLNPDTVLFYSDGHLDPTYHQHQSFKGRVDLVDRKQNDKDVSLTLKKVSRHDAGTYECRVESHGSRRKKRDIIDSEPISTIRLQVTGPKDGPSSSGLAAGVAVGLVLVAVGAAVAGVLMYKRQKRTGHPNAAGYNQPAETTPLEN